MTATERKLPTTAPDRPAWDTRCVRGCGAVVLDAGDTCADCLVAPVRAEIERVLGKDGKR